MRIAACDIDVEYLHYLEYMLRQIHTIDAATIIFYSEPDWLLSDVRQHEDAFDILLINQRLGQSSGIEYAAEVLKVNPWCEIIFISNENRINPDCYSTRHAFVLSKEQVPQYLPAALEKAITSVLGRSTDYVLVSSNYSKLLVPGKDILYIERVLRKSCIVLPYETVETFAAPVDILGNRVGNDFIQCHRSFYVNLRKVRGFQPDHFLLGGDVKVPIGRTFLSASEDAFLNISKRLLSVGV